MTSISARATTKWKKDTEGVEWARQWDVGVRETQLAKPHRFSLADRLFNCFSVRRPFRRKEEETSGNVARLHAPSSRYSRDASAFEINFETSVFWEAQARNVLYN